MTSLNLNNIVDGAAVYSRVRQERSLSGDLAYHFLRYVYKNRKLLSLSKSVQKKTTLAGKLLSSGLSEEAPLKIAWSILEKRIRIIPGTVGNQQQAIVELRDIPADHTAMQYIANEINAELRCFQLWSQLPDGLFVYFHLVNVLDDTKALEKLQLRPSFSKDHCLPDLE